MRQRDLASLDTLSRVANDLAGEFRLEPLLELILRSSVTLLGCESGSLCLVEPHTHTYRKQIDMQAGCQAGRAFPLEEGVTGAVARAGRPVTFRHYADVPGGHVSADSPLYNRAVIGVPIRLRSDLLGSLVVFAPDDEYCFGDADAQLLQRFATHAAIAMANAWGVDHTTLKNGGHINVASGHGRWLQGEAIVARMRRQLLETQSLLQSDPAVSRHRRGAVSRRPTSSAALF